MRTDEDSIRKTGLLSILWKRTVANLMRDGKRKDGSKTKNWEITEEERRWLIFSSAGCYELLGHPVVLGKLNGEQVSALFDTGSAISLVDAKYLKLIKMGQPTGRTI